MVVEISTDGDHDPPGVHVVVDGHGTVINPGTLLGVLRDPNVTRVMWGPYGDGGAFMGFMYRRRYDAGSNQIATEVVPFANFGYIKPYVDAHQARIASA